VHTDPRPRADVGAALDTSALRDPVPPAAVREFVALNRAQFGWTAARLGRTIRDAITIAVAAICLAFALLIAAFFLLLDLAAFIGPITGLAATAGLLLSPLVLVLVFLFGRLVLDAVRGSLRPRPPAKRSFRLAAFGSENGMDYRAVQPDPRREGTLFAAGDRRTARDVLTTTDDRFEIGNYSSAGGWVTERALRRFGYVRIALPHALPHLMLESRANRRRLGRSNLPWQFRSGQRLRLEGDFDRFFRLYVPDDYERDALRLFTPDLMALLIDRIRPFDVEIVDAALFLYSRVPFDMTAPATYHRALAVAETVGRPAARLALRWRDDRTVSGDLAWHGRRLAVRPAIGAVLATAYCVAVVVRWILVPG
jgi:hypothetical protein